MTAANHARPLPLITAPPDFQPIGVTKRFGSLVALDDVSMTVRPGTMHALLGGNGAGKSTLVKCIMGYYLPDAGQISARRQACVIRNPREALRLGIGMVYQHFTLVQNMTVAENLVLSRGQVPAVINWKEEYANLRALHAYDAVFHPHRCHRAHAGRRAKAETGNLQAALSEEQGSVPRRADQRADAGEADELLADAQAADASAAS